MKTAENITPGYVLADYCGVMGFWDSTKHKETQKAVMEARERGRVEDTEEDERDRTEAAGADGGDIDGCFEAALVSVWFLSVCWAAGKEWERGAYGWRREMRRMLYWLLCSRLRRVV